MKKKESIKRAKKFVKPFRITDGERADSSQIFNFPTGSVEPDDIVLFDNRGSNKAIYNNFNLFFGVTQIL